MSCANVDLSPAGLRLAILQSVQDQSSYFRWRGVKMELRVTAILFKCSCLDDMAYFKTKTWKLRVWGPCWPSTNGAPGLAPIATQLPLWANSSPSQLLLCHKGGRKEEALSFLSSPWLLPIFTHCTKHRYKLCLHTCRNSLGPSSERSVFHGTVLIAAGFGAPNLFLVEQNSWLVHPCHT